MTTAPNSAILDPVTNPVLTVAPQNKEDTQCLEQRIKSPHFTADCRGRTSDSAKAFLSRTRRISFLDYAKKNHFSNPVFFVDDGYSGTNYDRPGFPEYAGRDRSRACRIVITKDLSRLGRNSALTGLYTNFTFPQYGVRYIAINDNYDTIDPNSVNNDFAGIKNWFNEFLRPRYQPQDSGCPEGQGRAWSTADGQCPLRLCEKTRRTRSIGLLTRKRLRL